METIFAVVMVVAMAVGGVWAVAGLDSVRDREIRRHRPPAEVRPTPAPRAVFRYGEQAIWSSVSPNGMDETTEGVRVIQFDTGDYTPPAGGSDTTCNDTSSSSSDGSSGGCE